jgi:ribosomal protein S18 acetylase RimI-like enzyme
MNTETFGMNPPVLRCGRCGRFVNWEQSRLQIVCGCRAHLSLPPVLVREPSEAERQQALDLFARNFGAAQLGPWGDAASLGDASILVAEVDGEMAGALAWGQIEGIPHVLALATDPMWQRAGVGGHLIAELEMLLRGQHLQIVVTITNDNIPALYFYQRRGFRLSAILPDAGAAQAGNRKLGFAGITIVDEVQLVKPL